MSGSEVSGEVGGSSDFGVGETVEYDEDVSPRPLRSRVLRNWVVLFGGEGA